MNFNDKLKKIIWKYLFLLAISIGFGINSIMGANPVSTLVTGYSNTNISENNSVTDQRETNANATAYLLQCVEPGASASVSSSITCTHPTVTLTGSSPTSGVTYSWSGPDGFTSGAQSPVIHLPGTYYLTVTSPSGGCTSTASIVVARDTVQPLAQASVSGIINCATPSVTLQATTNITGATFWWIGPGSYTSPQQNPTVTVSGGYTLVVTNPANGCASTATAYAEKNTTLPLASAYVSGPLTCVINSVNLTSSSPTSGVTYSWSGPNGFTAGTQNTSVGASGTYTLTVTNPANNCRSYASVNVAQDISLPGAEITASANTITCTVINATLYGSSPSVGVTYGWTGPNGFTSDVQNPVVATAGDYVLTTTKAANGCVSNATFSLAVNKVKPGATALPSGQLNCLNSSITLQGGATSGSVSYRWTGPTAFGTSTLQNPPTTIKGGYILTTTDLNNGCQSQAVAIVVENKTLPASVSATNNGPLTCSATSVTITGNSTTSGATYSWSGPGYSSANRIASVGISGTYTLTVTHPTSFCTVVTSTAVGQNSVKPAAVSAGNNGPLTCSRLITTLSGSTSTSGVTYSWSGPGFSSNTQNPSVGTPGTYRLTVTDTNNGCKDSAVTIVAQDLTKPAAIAASNGGPLTCSLLSVNVTGSSSTEGVTYNWSGPGSFTSTAQNPTVNIAGTYKVVITNSVTGCKDSTTTVLAENVNGPGVSASSPDLITCDIRSVTMHASSPTTGVVFDWTGPNNYSSTEQHAVTNRPGDYTVVATNPANNCTSSYQITVAHDTLPPQNVTAVAPDVITCSRTLVTLLGNSGTEDVNYSWSGPNGYISLDQNPLVSEAGNYILSVTNFLNGCVTEANVLVSENKVKPANVSASASGILNCVNNSVTLTGNSSTTGVNYSWSGPGVSTSTQTAIAAQEGTYNLTVTDPSNGCEETRNVLVVRNTTVPTTPSTAVDTVLTCKRTSVTISATSSSGVSYKWSGPNGFTSNDSATLVHEPGTYTVTATYILSGCSAPTRNINVLQNITPPSGVAASVNGVLTCDFQVRSVSGSTSTPGTFSWTGPNGFTSSLPSPLVYLSGKYILTVTGNANGCIAKDSVTVNEDFAVPADVTASVSGPIDCINQLVILTGSSTTDGVEFAWEGPDDFTSIDAITFTNVGGNYKLTVTNPLNGCKDDATVFVVDNSAPPVCNLSVLDGSTVEESTNNTISTFYSPDYSYVWNITNWSIISGENSSALTYQAGTAGSSATISVHVTNNLTGCESDCSVTLSAVPSGLKSAPSEMSIIPSQKSENKTEDVLLKAYPIPSDGKVFLEFVSPEQTDALVTVYNTNGAAIATLFKGIIEPNQNYQVTFNDEVNIPSGIYICVLKTKNKTVFSKITIK
jgi:hypothetical protein